MSNSIKNMHAKTLIESTTNLKSRHSNIKLAMGWRTGKQLRDWHNIIMFAHPQLVCKFLIYYVR